MLVVSELRPAEVRYFQLHHFDKPPPPPLQPPLRPARGGRIAMSISRQSLSPTANLLRNSRLFSLPNPLPRPNVGETYGAGITKASDSATLPYPTHQAIATTKSSLSRGDWGLKRPLPTRSRLLQTSNPVLRVTQLDTIEHVTDFDSAADHVRSRQKFEEMGVPMMKGMPQMRERDISSANPNGAFEIRDDTTSYDTDLGLDEAGLYLQALKKSSGKNQRTAPENFKPFSPPPVDAAVHNARRWKHDGPWLPGMDASSYLSYLTTQISHRRKEFNTCLREFVRNEIYATRQLNASKSSEAPPLDEAEAQKWRKQQATSWADISEKDIDTGIKALRRETANNPLTSRLVKKLILPFLRLPTIAFKSTAYHQDAKRQDAEQYNFDAELAPLSTHPSAGLGYLRTKAYLSTHPILGPQKQPAPVPARVVQARRSARGNTEPYAKLGVGGFVANDEHRATDAKAAVKTSGGDVETIDVDTPGGRKVNVHPAFASVSNDGRVHIKLFRAVGAEVQVARGALEDVPPGREGVVDDVLGDLGGGKSGVRELDEGRGRAGGNARELDAFGDQARQLGDFLGAMKPEGKGRPAPGFPGVADALR